MWIPLIVGFVSSLLKLTAIGSATYYDVRYTVEIKFKEDKIKYEITNYYNVQYLKTQSTVDMTM